jgi:hypothetical protein
MPEWCRATEQKLRYRAKCRNDLSGKILGTHIVGPMCQCPFNLRDFIQSYALRRLIGQQSKYFVDKRSTAGEGIVTAHNQGSIDF